MKRIYLVLFMVLYAVQGIAQDATVVKAFKDLNAHYQNLTAFSMDFELRYFDQNGKLVMTQKGAVTHSETIHYTQIGNRVTLLTDRNYISVNEDNHLLVFNEFEPVSKKGQEKPQNPDISAMLDSLWANQKGLTFRTIQSKPGTLRVYIEDKENEYFESYELLVDTEKHNLLEFVYYFRSSEDEDQLSKIQIAYSNQTSRPNLNAENLKVKYYIERKKNLLVAAERFKTYELIDQTKIQPGL